MTGSPCPEPEALEEFASGESTDEAVEAHLGECPACRQAVEEAREVNRFLRGMRSSLGVPDRVNVAPHNERPPVESALVAGYTIEEEIHRGGQGVVYRAIQTRTHRAVAIKVLLGGRGATSRQKERFEREIRIAAALSHPNIATVYESGMTADGRYALVMEHIDGLPLDRWSHTLDADRGREARRRALRRRLAVMARVCDGVLHAHQHSIVHRDLKPSNILVDGAGEPHILDFGVARDTRPDENPRLTSTGEFAGTLAYASPEQVSGDPSKTDTRTDIYSLGVIMYELVSGRMPYVVDGPMSKVIRGIEGAEPAPLRRNTRDPADPWVDGEVSTIILKAMAKDPARRYQTAAGLRDDIVRYLAGEAIEASRDSAWYVLRKAAARHRVVVGAAGVIMVLLAVFGAAMARQAYRLEVGRRELSASLSASNVERARSMAAAGSTHLAEDLVFSELARAGVTEIVPEGGFTGPPEALHAYWAAWDVFRSSQSVATVRMGRDANGLWPVVMLVYFDEGGRRLTALSSEGALTSWAVGTWEVVRERILVEQVEGASFSACLAPGGSIALFGAGMLRVIDPDTGRVQAQADDPERLSLRGAFSPDGTLLATTGLGNRLCVRDGRTLAVIFAETAVLDGAPAEPRLGGPTFSPDGSLVGVARSNDQVDLVNALSGTVERTLVPPESLVEMYRFNPRMPLHGPAFAPDGSIAGWKTLNPVLWPADGGAPRDLGDPGGQICALAFLTGPTGLMLASTGLAPGDGAGSTNIWDVASGARVARWKHPMSSTTLATSTDAGLIAVGLRSGMVQVYRADPGPHVTRLRDGRVWPIASMALSPDGRHLVLIARQDPAQPQHVELIDILTRQTIRRDPRNPPWVIELAFARDGQSWFESDWGGRIRQWKLGTSECIREFAFPESIAPEGENRRVAGAISHLLASPDGRTLAGSRNDGLIGLWDVASGDWIGVLDSNATGVARIEFSPDGRTLVARHLEAVVLWDVPTRRPKRSGAIDLSYLNAVRWSPTEPILAQSDPSGGGLQFVDAESGRVLRECPPQTSGLGMAFHPDGAVIMAAAFDGSIRLWDTRTGRELLSLQKHTQVIFDMVLTPDGNTLISYDMIGNIFVWDLAYYNDHIRRELERRIALEAAP